MKNKITSFMHCATCVEELMAQGGGSPRDYARLSVGFTPKGFQVWCNRHKKNVAAFDFKGQKIAFEKGSVK